LRLGDEGAAVAGVAAGRRGDCPHAGHAHGVAQRAKAHQRAERLLDCVGREQAGGLHLAAETGEHLLVEDRRRAAGQSLVGDETHGVRADVEHRDRRSVVDPALCEFPAATFTHRRVSLSANRWPLRRDTRYPRSARRDKLRGGDVLSDLPRPDRLGLVMKYLCALNGSSPSAALIRVDAPSGKSVQLCSLSLKLAIMIWSSTCSCTVGLWIGHSASTR